MLILFAVILTVVTVSAMQLFRLFGESFFPAYRHFTRAVQSVFSSLSAKLPFPVWEAGSVVLLFLFVFITILLCKKKMKFRTWLGSILTVISVLFAMFTFFWGLDHYAPPISSELGITIEDSTESELVEATKYYMSMAEAEAEKVDRDADSLVCARDLTELGTEAGTAYEPLWQEYPIFIGSTEPVKVLELYGPILDYSGITGIFIAMTGESTVNPNTYVVSMPMTMCHEAAHRCGIAAEDEANFAAILACSASDDCYFRYSGYYQATIYCYNALYKVDSAAALALWNDENEQLRQDILAGNAHYKPYEGTIQKAADKVNDTYLKAFNEASGTQSYGEAADYLIAWYFQKIKE